MDQDNECILCGGALTETVGADGYRWDGRIFVYRRCIRCRSKVVQPLPSNDELDRMYRHGEYHVAYYEEYPASEWPSSLATVHEGAGLLDFGCGDGGFLVEAGRRGFDAVGIELDLTAREAAQRNSGRPVLSLEEVVASGRRFDVIRLGDVLEHLPAPAETLRRLEPILSPEGVFVIEGPLEENPSLVRLFNRVFTRLKRAAGRELLTDLPPLHLSRTSAAGQARFFVQTMGYELKLFEVSETGWPYLLPGATSANARTRVRSAIGRLAVLLANATRPLGMNLGNRFLAIATPIKQRS